MESAEVSCLQALFSRNNQQLIVAPNTGGLQIYKIKNNVLNVVQNIEFNTDGKFYKLYIFFGGSLIFVLRCYRCGNIFNNIKLQ